MSTSPNIIMLRLHTKWKQRQATRFGDVFVKGVGNDVSPIAMILGCAPTAADVLAKAPFKDDTGYILRALLGSAGLTSATAWLTHLFKFRFPNNRLPTDDEIQSIRYLLYTEWTVLHRPKLIIPIGPTATIAVLGTQTAAHAQVGKPIGRKSKCGLNMLIYPMVHPMHGIHNRCVRKLIDQHWNSLTKLLYT